MVRQPVESFVDHLLFGDHSLADVDVEGAVEHQVDDVNHFFLADATEAIFCLGEDSRVPVDFDEDHGGGRKEVDPHTRCLESSDEDLFVALLKGTDDFFAIFLGGAAVE